MALSLSTRRKSVDLAASPCRAPFYINASPTGVAARQRSPQTDAALTIRVALAGNPAGVLRGAMSAIVTVERDAGGEHGRLLGSEVATAALGHDARPRPASDVLGTARLQRCNDLRRKRALLNSFHNPLSYKTALRQLPSFVQRV